MPRPLYNWQKRQPSDRLSFNRHTASAVHVFNAVFMMHFSYFVRSPFYAAMSPFVYFYLCGFVVRSATKGGRAVVFTISVL